MEDRIYDTAIPTRHKLEENGEGKTTDKCPAIGLMNRWIAEWGSLNGK
jgi:hypothetical protein